MRKVFLVLLCLLLCGCQPTPKLSDSSLRLAVVYDIASEQMLSPREVAISAVSEKAMIQTLFAAFQTAEKSSHSPAVPRDVRLEQYTLENRTLTLFLSAKYDELSGILRTLADAALTHAFCALNEVDALIIHTPDSESAARTAQDYLFVIPQAIQPEVFD